MLVTHRGCGGPPVLTAEACKHLCCGSVGATEGHALTSTELVWETPNKPLFPHKRAGFLYLVLKAGRMKNTKEDAAGLRPEYTGGKEGLRLWVALLLSPAVPLSGRSATETEIPFRCSPLLTSLQEQLISQLQSDVLKMLQCHKAKPSPAREGTCRRVECEGFEMLLLERWGKSELSLWSPSPPYQRGGRKGERLPPRLLPKESCVTVRNGRDAGRQPFPALPLPAHSFSPRTHLDIEAFMASAG